MNYEVGDQVSHTTQAVVYMFTVTVFALYYGAVKVMFSIPYQISAFMM